MDVGQAWGGARTEAHGSAAREGVWQESYALLDANFLNPIVSSELAESVLAKALSLGVAARAEDMPCFKVGADQKTLAAAWLIEKSEFAQKQFTQKITGASGHASTPPRRLAMASMGA